MMVDWAVNMRLRSKIQDGTWLKPAENIFNKGTVTNVTLYENVVLIAV